jgi:hypothetical protein
MTERVRNIKMPKMIDKIGARLFGQLVISPYCCLANLSF